MASGSPGQLLLAPDKRGELDRQVPRKRIQTPKRRELTGQPRHLELKDALGARQIAQPMLSQLDQPHLARERIPDQLLGGQRDQHLTAMRHRRHPRGSVQRRTEIVAVSKLTRTGMDPHPHPQRPRSLPALSRQRHLPGRRRQQRALSRLERREQAIPGRLDHHTARCLHRVAQDLVVARQRAFHRLGMLLPQARRTLQISKEEGHRPRRQLGTHRPHPVPCPTQAPRSGLSEFPTTHDARIGPTRRRRSPGAPRATLKRNDWPNR